MRNKNGMTFSPLGFGNWIPVIIAGDRPKSGQDFLSFSVTGDMPKHPSPKPIACMTRLVERLSEIGNLDIARQRIENTGIQAEMKI